MNKKLKKAAALQYDPKDTAPRVIAKGKGMVAERLIEKGVESNIPIYEDPKLTEALTHLDIGDTIPPELYEIVAELLIFVSDLDKLGDKIDG